jgi:hypothetical protein
MYLGPAIKAWCHPCLKYLSKAAAVYSSLLWLLSLEAEKCFVAVVNFQAVHPIGDDVIKMASSTKARTSQTLPKEVSHRNGFWFEMEPDAM